MVYPRDRDLATIDAVSNLSRTKVASLQPKLPQIPKRRCYVQSSDCCTWVVHPLIPHLRSATEPRDRSSPSDMTVDQSRRNPVFPGANIRTASDASRYQRHETPFSRNSFASFTFVARYGLPPRSGWLSSISVRCAFRTLSFVRLPSLSCMLATAACLSHACDRC